MNSKHPKTIIAIFLFLMAAQFADAQNLSQGLTLYLPFSGNANDASGNGNNGIVTSATLTSDANGNPNSAYYFDGIDDQIVVPHNTILNPVPDSGFSITAKVNMQGFYDGFCYNNNIINKGSNMSSSPVGYYGLISTQTIVANCNFEDTANHNFRFDFNGNGNALGTQLNATINNPPYVQLNQWDCLVGIFKGDTSYMYVNGVLRYKINTTSKPGNTEDISIGYDKYGAASLYPFWFQGVIDEIRLYDRALTTDEIDLYCSNVILPITLTSIKATNIGNRNRIDWMTALEVESDYFELERSADAKQFSYLTKVEAKGIAGSYSYRDEHPVKGANYYRLKMFDKAGKIRYSEVVKAVLNRGDVFSVAAFPNPVSNMLTVTTIGNQANNAMLDITDVTGKTIKILSMSSSERTIDMSSYANGIYLVKYSDAKQTQTIRITKQ